MSKREIARAPTGIAGFDSLIGGGFERNSVTTLKGGAGTGKTIFSMQFLYNGAALFKEPGVFISFEETKESVFSTSNQFGWDMERLERNGALAILNYRPHDMNKALKDGSTLLANTIESLGAKRVVVDSLTAFTALFKNPYMEDEGIINFFQMLKSCKCTALVTDEKNIQFDSYTSDRMAFLSDSLIHFYNIRKGALKFRALEIKKMRRTRHSEKLSLFKIDDCGFKVYPETDPFG